MSFQEIATALGLSVVTVERAYQTGMRKLRLCLMKHKALRYELQEGLDMLESFKRQRFERNNLTKGNNNDN